MQATPVRVLFVCLGNICRSPTAEAVFRKLAAEAGLAAVVDSAGTGAWHVGHPPDARSAAAANARGYDLSDLRARKVTPADFAAHDLIIAMDRDNLAVLNRMRPASGGARLSLMMDHAGKRRRDVPDPYMEGGFDRVLDMIENACQGLIAGLKSGHQPAQKDSAAEPKLR